MARRATHRREMAALDKLAEMAAPGYLPWQLMEPICVTGKRRWPTEHGAEVALRQARGTRLRRARGQLLGKVECRAYQCHLCSGFHLTSMPLSSG